METKQIRYVIEFYEKEIWEEGYIPPDELTHEDIVKLSKTLYFASWMLATHYKEAVNTMKSTLKKMRWKS